MRYLILAQSESTAYALGAWLELLGEPGIVDKCADDPRLILSVERDDWPIAHSYDRLSRALEDAAFGDAPTGDSVTVLVDALLNPDLLNVVAEGGRWESLIAMLILTFPEFQWVFGVWGASKAGNSRISELGRQHCLASLLALGESDPIFDPTGLRNWVRERTNDCLTNELHDDLKLPLRERSAAVIEDERAYQNFNGYCAYRFGFRAEIVDTWVKMKQRFGTEAKDHGYWLLLEDMSLNFADREKGVKLHDLQSQRAEHCPQLNSLEAKVEISRYRVLITTGQTRPGDDAFCRNRDYLRKKAEGRGVLALKPASGIFDLWKQAGLMRRHDQNRIPGFAPSFDWPPKMPGRVEEKDGHGSPGKLLMVAEKLIERAAAIKSEVTSVGDAVLGATLATDALELTGCRTPTTAIDALSLKHQFEVMAECQFSGVEYHISIKPRIADIARDLDAICLWFDKSKRHAARLNGRMHILNQLVGILREHNQFDEEQVCMNEVRRLNTTLWMNSRPWRYIFWLPIRYVEYLLSSFPRFVSVVVVWVLVLATVIFVADPNAIGWGFESFLKGLSTATIAFISAGSPLMSVPEKTTWIDAVNAISVVSSFLHLGVFISHLYTVVSRK